MATVVLSLNNIRRWFWYIPLPDEINYRGGLTDLLSGILFKDESNRSLKTSIRWRRVKRLVATPAAGTRTADSAGRL